MYKLLLIGLGLFLLGPLHATALSCMSPDGMISTYISDSDYVIVRAIPQDQSGETFVHSNVMSGEMKKGITSQGLDVAEVYQGELSGSITVSFSYDNTWGYYCTNAPPVIGSDNLYIVSIASGEYKVSNVFPIDSDMAKKYLDALDIEEPIEVLTNEKEVKLRQLAVEIRELIVQIRAKFAEFKALKASM